MNNPLEEPDNKGWLEDTKWNVFADLFGALYKSLINGAVSVKETVEKIRRIV